MFIQSLQTGLQTEMLPLLVKPPQKARMNSTFDKSYMELGPKSHRRIVIWYAHRLLLLYRSVSSNRQCSTWGLDVVETQLANCTISGPSGSKTTRTSKTSKILTHIRTQSGEIGPTLLWALWSPRATHSWADSPTVIALAFITPDIIGF